MRLIGKGGDVFINVVDDFPQEKIEADTQLFIQATLQKSIIFDRLVGTFLIYEGKRVVVIPEPKVTIEQVRIYLVGTVMAMILYQRGFLILHGSGVVVNGKAIAFVGRSGWGKSSIAAALNHRGYGLVSDDVFPLDLNSETPVVYPGFSQYKISEETAAVLGHDSNSLLNRDVENRGYLKCQNFATDALPLDRIYLLTKASDNNAIESIEPIDIMTELLCHSVPTIWGMKQPPEHFFQCSKLVQNVAIYRLQRSDDLKSLPRLAQLVEQHIRETTPTAITI